MGIDGMFDKEKINNLNKLVRSLEGKKIETINKAIDEAVNNETIETIKVINDAFIGAATALAEKMLSQGESVRDVMDYTGLTKAEVTQIQSRLKGL